MLNGVVVPSTLKKYPTISRLYKDQGKSMDRGKKLILARAIADKINIYNFTSSYNDRYSVKLFVNSHLPDIQEICMAMSAVYILEDDFIDEITDIITSILQWKMSLVDTNNSLQCAFTGEKQTVLDEFTSITRFIEPVYICGLVDIAESSSFYYSSYRQIVEEVYKAKN